VEDVAVPVGSPIAVLEEDDPPAPVAPALSPILERSEPDVALCPKEIAPIPCSAVIAPILIAACGDDHRYLPAPAQGACLSPSAVSISTPAVADAVPATGRCGASASLARASPSRDSGYVRQIGLPDKDKQRMDRQWGVATTHTSARRRHRGMSSFLPFLFRPSPSRYRLSSPPIVPSSAASSLITPPSPPTFISYYPRLSNSLRL
jgi:hypothetical protein